MSVRMLCLALCLLFGSAAAASNTSVLQQAQGLLSRGEGQAAYELLLPLEDRLAGDPAYDLLLAQAALLVGQANIALFILERVVFSHPRQYQARLLMATAYFRLEAYEQANEVLEALLQEEAVDGQTLRQAHQMREEILRHTRRNSLNAYAGFGLGNDSNANAATASLTFLGYDLAANSIATPSASMAATVGAQSSHRLAARSVLFTAVDWAANQYPDATFVNNDSLGFQLGWQKNGKYVLAYQSQTVNVADAFNNRGNHIYGMVNSDTPMKWRPFLRLGEVRYDAGSSIKDVSQAIIGTQFSLSDWIRGSRMSILLAEDMAIESGSPYGRSYTGMQFHTESRYLNRITVAFKAGILYSQYHGLFFGSRREERQSNIGMDVRYRAAGSWDCSLYAGLTDSWSTIALYQYDRLTVGLNIKRNFVR